MKQHAVTMLGTGLIGDFYTQTLHGQRNRDRVRVSGRFGVSSVLDTVGRTGASSSAGIGRAGASFREASSSARFSASSSASAISCFSFSIN